MRFIHHPGSRSRAPALAVLLAALLAGLSGSSTLTAADSMLPPGALRPTARQRQLAPRIASELERKHFSQRKIDDQFSAQVLDRYLASLDGQRSYFTAADVAGLQHLTSRFDDMIHSGALQPAFGVFALYQQRNRERVNHAIVLLETEPNWSLDEQFQYDREQAPWPRDTAELNELWRRRVKADALSLILTGKPWSEAQSTLRKRYQRVLERVGQVTGDEVFESIMNAYTAVYDPHSNYFSPRNSEEYRIQMSLSYDGIGASLQMVDDYVTISALLPGGPAAKDGSLKPNDRIIGVAQGRNEAVSEVIGERLDDVVQLIRGRSGTAVRLQILPAGAAPGAEKFVELQRGKVTLENQAARKDLKPLKIDNRELKVGVITVPGFYQDVQARSARDQNYRSTTRDVRRLLQEFDAEGGVDALILDLRGDGGGFLPEATALTGLFIDRGPVVQLKDAGGSVEVLDDPDNGVAYDGPLAVLVDRTSASASEIFAGAIQDYRRGPVLGQTTFGKGTVQNLIPLDRWEGTSTSGQLTVTIGKFYRVTGASTQLRGVVPDIVLPSAIREQVVGESALHFPLPWDQIEAARFAPLAQATMVSSNLVRAHEQRVTRDADYRWLTASLAALEQQDNGSLQLNLDKRKLERSRLEAERLTRENERRRAAGLAPLATLEDLNAADAPDVVLAQAVRIAADLATGTRTNVTASDSAPTRLPARPLSRRNPALSPDSPRPAQ